MFIAPSPPNPKSMKYLLLALPILSLCTAKAQTDQKPAIQRAAMNYIEGFYKGDTVMLKQGIPKASLKTI